MQERTWIKSGVVEEFDERQVRFLELIMENVRLYYGKLYRTAPRYKYPLSLSRLARLCNRSVYSISLGIRILANTVTTGEERPLIHYERVHSRKHAAKRPFRIFLK